MKLELQPLAAALALLAAPIAAPRVAPTADEFGGAPDPLARLAPGARWSWSLRRSAWCPLGSGEARAPLALRLELERVATDEDGAALLELRLSPLEGRPEEGARRYELAVDRAGRLGALEPLDIDAPPIALAELRAHLEALLGVGVAAAPLEYGRRYPLSAGAGGGLAAAQLRLDALREVRGERASVFSLVDGRAPRAVGEACYAAADGLLRTLSYKPRPEPRAGAAAGWLVVERLEEPMDER